MFKSSSKEVHSLMEDGIHDFMRYKYYLRALRYFGYFSGGNLKFHYLVEELNLLYMKAPRQY